MCKASLQRPSIYKTQFDNCWLQEKVKFLSLNHARFSLTHPYLLPRMLLYPSPLTA